MIQLYHNMPFRILIFALAGTFLVGGVSIFSSSNAGIHDQKQYLLLPDKKIELIVVSTPETRTRGLSGMESLSEDSAMLFVFMDPDAYGIWMKEMKFPIDIVWLDEKNKILKIEQNVSPNTYPTVFFPPQKSLYILEANAGFAEKNALSVGKILNFTR